MLKREDRNLGMDRPISRRDVLNGIGAIAASALLPGRAFADKMLALERAGSIALRGAAPYPPALTGLRGSHVGSFEVAHQLAWDGRKDWGPALEPDPNVYDLVVVGGGISGLAAAHFHRKENPKARILILDNHDDCGRHELFSTSFETIERNIREQLASMLSSGGFDPARDIEAITVNRWAHGYAMGGNTLFDAYDRDDPRAPHFRARKPFGRIAIANSDAAARGMLDSAVGEAHRAITELS